MYGPNVRTIEIPVEEYQELLWARDRIKAALIYIKLEDYISKRSVASFLTGEIPEYPDREEETE